MKLNDKNTKYFHAIAIGRSQKKRIRDLKVGGRVVKDPRVIKKEAIRFLIICILSPTCWRLRYQKISYQESMKIWV